MTTSILIIAGLIVAIVIVAKLWNHDAPALLTPEEQEARAARSLERHEEFMDQHYLDNLPENSALHELRRLMFYAPGKEIIADYRRAVRHERKETEAAAEKACREIIAEIESTKLELKVVK